MTTTIDIHPGLALAFILATCYVVTLLINRTRPRY